MLTENRGSSTFYREENNYVVPDEFSIRFLALIIPLLDSHGFREEKYENTLSRSIYFLSADNRRFPLGLTIRYRDYTDHRLDDREEISSSGHGTYEIKWTEPSNGRPNKRKVKINAPYSPKISIDELLQLAISKKQITEEDGRRIVLLLGGNKVLFPTIAVDYDRTRFSADDGNVLSVEKGLYFYYFDRDTQKFIRMRSDETGDELIVEYKESIDLKTFRWQLFRLLVSTNAERFIGKKGYAISNLYLTLADSTPETVTKDIPDKEFETKANILGNVGADAVIEMLYDQLPIHLAGRFVISPGFPGIHNQGSINEYFMNPKSDTELEMKFVHFKGKYRKTLKHHIKRVGHVLIRSEEKMPTKDFTRDNRREDRLGFVRKGKTMRIRRAFWILSSKNRLYKVSIDESIVYPYNPKRDFVQLEIEYTGTFENSPQKPGEGRESSQNLVENEADVINDLNLLHQTALIILDQNDVGHEEGGRKAELLGG